MSTYVVGQRGIGKQPAPSRGEERLAICRACPMLRKNYGPIPDQCSVCNCFVVLKTAVPGESCPKGKW